MSLLSLMSMLSLMSLRATPAWAQPENFPTSLHATRAGKLHWYGTAHHGFESFTHVPISDIGCVQCHGATDADGQAYGSPYQPGCSDCHSSSHSAGVQEETCYGCHGRQAVEANLAGVSDVHRQAGMKCWDCHSMADIHGDGTAYSSMFEEGAVGVDCEQCHPAGSLPAEHADYDPHGGKLHCSACHARTVVSCYNCHFESMTEAHVKRARQTLSDFVLLVKRTRDGKVGTGSFQSLTYHGSAFVAFAPYASHTIVRHGRTCTDCHVNMGGHNDAIEQYNRTGRIQLARQTDDGSLTWTHGVIPVPEDYAHSLTMDFLAFDGDISAPVGQDTGSWSSLGKAHPDGEQMMYAAPLTRSQMDHLGFAPAAPTAVREEQAAGAPTRFALAETYPNPFNGSVIIPYHIARRGRVRLEIFAETGQKIATLVDRVQAPGTYQVRWDGRAADGVPVASGTYLAELRMGDGLQRHSEKLVLVK